MYPNRHHFAALMEGYALSGDPASALAVMNAAERAGVKPNVVMYTILVASHARQGDAISAMHMFKQMVLAGIPPDVPAIDALVSAFYKVHQHDKARQLLESLWRYIQPFPEDMQKADLETMISRFRSLAPYRSKGVKFNIPRRYSIHHHLRRWIGAYRLYFKDSGKKRQTTWRT
jgi:pentatricopeptide repeat protein